MSLNDIRQFNFYYGYLWNQVDFANLQGWIYDSVQGVANGAFGSSSLTGLAVTAPGTMALNVTNGIGVNASGRLLVNTATQNSPAFASPAGNPAYSLLVLRPNDTDGTPVPSPSDPTQSVNLHHFLGATLAVINGTPAATPSYPAALANDIILCGVKLTSGQASITSASLDYSVAQTPHGFRRSVRTVNQASPYSVTTTDQILSVSTATNGSQTINLLPASSVAGLMLIVSKKDIDGNLITLVPAGSDTIEESHVTNQNNMAILVSNGLGWQSLVPRDSRITYDSSEFARTVASGSTYTQFGLSIPVAQTFVVNGSLVSGNLVVLGNLTDNGTVVSLY